MMQCREVFLQSVLTELRVFTNSVLMSLSVSRSVALSVPSVNTAQHHRLLFTATSVAIYLLGICR